MKKLFITAIGAVLSTAAMATPLAPMSTAELLGLRPGTAATSGDAFSLSGTGALIPAQSGPMRITGVDTSDPSKVHIVGCVVSPDHITGMWSYTTDSWAPERLNEEANKVFATGGGMAASDGYYYVTQYREAMGFEEIKTINYKMNGDWSEYDSYTSDITKVATTMAYSPARDQAFGCFVNADRNGYVFCEYNYSYFGIKRTIAEIDTDKVWAGSAFSSDNTLYAITRQGDLYTVDLNTGAMTLVGSTGIETKYLADATIDTDTDTMYWCVNSDTENALYTVNIKTAAASKLYDLTNEEQICGMFIARAEEETPATAPAAISSSPSLSFSGTSLSGKISFSLPRYQFDQQALLDADTELTWTVYANGKEAATGTGLPNARINADIAVDAPDSYYFTVVVSNAAGSSPARGIKKYLSPDTPKAPTSFQLKFSGSTVTLNWNGTGSSGVNGGSVAYSNATYTVVRYPDMKTVVDNEAVRTATDEIPASDEHIDYYYVLTATVEGLTSEGKKSAVLPTGPIVPAATVNFDASTSTFGWTFTEGDPADGTVWAWYDYDKAVRMYASKACDDWAISPAVIVKGGSAYPFAIDIKTSNYYEETFEVLWGTEPAIEAMTNTIVAESKQKSTTYTTYTGSINTVADGKIYFAIHDKTATASQLYFRNIVIGEGVITKAPAAVTFSVKPETNGTAKATITYTVPSTDIEGNPLDENSALTKVEIVRDGETIATLTDNIPAEADATFVDSEGLTLGKHSYNVVAYNAYGAGASEAVEVMVGPGKPAAPANAKMIEEGNTGKVTISWDAVTADADGNAILPSAITYKVVDRAYNVVADNLTDTSFSLQAVEEGKQEFRQYGVYAVTVGGESKLSGTAYKPVGTPYPTPWAESFANGGVSSIFGYNYISGSEPWQFGQNAEWSATPQDGDFGLAYFEAYGLDQTALVTGKIDLSGIANPAITYYTYRYSSSDYSNVFTVEADRGDGNGFVEVQTDPIFIGEAATWHKVTVDLSDYDGESVVFRFNPTTVDGTSKNKGAFYFLDNIRITSHSDYNLTASRIEAPSVVKANEDFEINVTVTNTGDKDVRGYDIELWSGDDFIDSKPGAAIAPEASATVTFVTSNTVLDGETRSYHATIVFADDEIESDNATEPVTVGIVTAAVPVASGLAATQDGDNVNLTWTEPDMATAAPAAVTETFETADTWAQAVEGWKIIDGDAAPLISVNNPKFPFSAGKLAAWWITDQGWDSDNETSVDLWRAHSGTKYLTSGSVMRGSTPVQCDDWAISPHLFGCEQVISFYARSFFGQGSYAGAYQEDFEVLYSTSTTNIDDFVSAGEVKKVPFSWTKYSFRMPTGALYFAIRSRSTDQFFLFIDDVTYIPATGETSAPTVKGYNIYRDGRKINTELVAGTSYTDNSVRTEGDHTYVVTAVYAEGESRPSNEAYLSYSGALAPGAATLTVVAGEGFIEVAGAEGIDIDVFNAAGMTVASARGKDAVRFTVEAGIYIVRAGSTAAKVAVK